MDIPVNSAQQIVDELGNVLLEKVSVMDGSGQIIASTDPERVGELHMGALRIIKNDLPILAEKESAPEKGIHAGINLPVLFEGKIAGVVGVTGDPEKLSKYAVVIQKMTEILLANTYQDRLLEKDKRRQPPLFNISGEISGRACFPPGKVRKKRGNGFNRFPVFVCVRQGVPTGCRHVRTELQSGG